MGNEAQKKIRSKEYPAHTLNESIEFIVSLKNFLLLPSISYSAAADELHTSTNTKSFKYKISAAKQFGLIATSTGQTISFLDPAKKFAFPINETEQNQLKLHCFSTPKLYIELLEKFQDKSMPSQKSLENILLHEHGISPNAKETAARVFIETANEVGAVKGGLLKLDFESPPQQIAPFENDDYVPNLDNASVDLNLGENKHVFNSYYTFEIPTLEGKNAVLQIPHGVNVKDIDFIDKFINNMLPDFFANLKEEIGHTTE